MLLACSINPSAPNLFHVHLSPYTKSDKPPRGHHGQPPTPAYLIDTAPKKLE